MYPPSVQSVSLWPHQGKGLFDSGQEATAGRQPGANGFYLLFHADLIRPVPIREESYDIYEPPLFPDGPTSTSPPSRKVRYINLMTGCGATIASPGPWSTYYTYTNRQERNFHNMRRRMRNNAKWPRKGPKRNPGDDQISDGDPAGQISRDSQGVFAFPSRSYRAIPPLCSSVRAISSSPLRRHSLSRCRCCIKKSKEAHWD